MRPLVLAVICCIAVLAAPRVARATWPNLSTTNLPLCTVAGPQFDPVLATDGAGGMIVAWYDRRGANYDLYAQHVTADGDRKWSADGQLIYAGTSDQFAVAILDDGAGGAFLAWIDNRNPTNDLFIQRIDSNGAKLWATDGVALCVQPNIQEGVSLVTDGAGGVIALWQDARTGTTDIYAQRVDGAGAAQWAINGVAVCNATNNQFSPKAIADGLGGAIITWQDFRTGSFDIYVQRINSVGTGVWTLNGVLMCSAANDQQQPVIVSDGTGGALIAWVDGRSAGASDIYARRVTSNGVAAWTADGSAVCTAAQTQSTVSAASDDAGGMIVAWDDTRASNFDIYTQRINGDGTVLWTANGQVLCGLPTTQAAPRVSADGTGGALITWTDYRSGAADIYAQRMAGIGYGLWVGDGVAIANFSGDQTSPTILSDGTGGALLAWSDARTFDFNIYAQRIDGYGWLGNAAGSITSVRDVLNDQGGRVKVSWSASYADANPFPAIAEYRVWRSVPDALVAARARLGARAARDADEAAAHGGWFMFPHAGNAYAWELVGTQAASALPNYSFIATTTSDSAAGGNPYTAFMVEARDDIYAGAPHWFSAPDSGYSVDNLAPAVPAPFAGSYTGGTTTMYWNANLEADLAGYRLHRGLSPGFVPNPATLIAALTRTGYADAAGTPYVYKLSAIDIHGNESAFATLPIATVGVDEAQAIAALSFGAPQPNPARGSALLAFALPSAGHVRIAAFDAAGRRVAVVVDEALPAGEHRRMFALQDANGRALPDGLYLLRLEAAGRVLTRRLAAMR